MAKPGERFARRASAAIRHNVLRRGARVHFVQLALALAATLTAGLRPPVEPTDEVRIEPQIDAPPAAFPALRLRVMVTDTQLQPDLRFRLLVDGHPLERDSWEPEFWLRRVAPGAYTFQAQLIDPGGYVVRASKPVTIIVQRGAQIHEA